LVADITRSEAKSVTGFWAPGHKRFVYAYPEMRTASVKIYFLSSLNSPPPEIANVPDIQLRKTLTSAWATSWPFFLTINREEQVESVSRLMVEYSMPLAKSRRGPRATRERPFKLPQEVSSGKRWEGHSTTITINRYERDLEARAQRIQKHGESCLACGANFGEIYGPNAKGLIHVHHVVAISTRGGSYEIDPAKDLVPLCPNCHAVAHISAPPLTVDEIKLLISSK
jgi:hypothetical protein